MLRLVTALAFSLGFVFCVPASGEAPPSYPYTAPANQLGGYILVRPTGLRTAVEAADIIFRGVTTTLDLSRYANGNGTYSGDVAPESFLKGKLDRPSIYLTWEPSATGLEAGSSHIFFLQKKGASFKVVKEIFVHKPPFMACRTFGAYDGGLEATLQSIRLMLDPLLKQPDYAATLEKDMAEKDGWGRQCSAVWLACEVWRPECLGPLLYAIKHQTFYWEEGVTVACQLGGAEAAAGALAILPDKPDHEFRIFASIGAAKNPKSIPVLEKFGTENPQYRVSCAYAIRDIDPEKLRAIVQQWRTDGKHAGITHALSRRWGPTFNYSADALLTKFLNREQIPDGH